MLNTVHKQWQDEKGVLSNNGLIKSISLYVTSHEILGPNEVPGRN